MAMSYELIAILATSVLELTVALAGFMYLGRQGRYAAEHMAAANRYLANQVTVVGQQLGEQVTSLRQDLEAQLRRNAYLQTMMHNCNAELLKEILALLEKEEL
jgi:hypothetical protein